MSTEFDPQPQLLKGFRLQGEFADKGLIPPAAPAPIHEAEPLPEEIGDTYTEPKEKNILAFKRPEKK